MIFRRKETVTTHAKLGADGATRVDAHLRMPHGVLRLAGGAADLLDATFVTPEGAEPEVEYDVQDTQGTLEITQSRLKSMRNFDGKNEWDVRFGRDVPLALRVDLSAGELTGDLAQVPLSSFKLKESAGRATLDLGGDQVFLTAVDIEQSAGELDLRLPGTYPLLRTLDMQSSAGELKLDLRGTLLRDLDVQVRTSAGHITVLLPSNANITASVRATVSKVRATGLVSQNGGWVSSGSRPGPQVNVAVRATAGDITLVQE